MLTQETEADVACAVPHFFQERDQVQPLLERLCYSLKLNEDSDSTSKNQVNESRFLSATHQNAALSFSSQDDDYTLDCLLSILDKYQEQPMLLDPYLDEIVNPVMETLRVWIHEKEPLMTSHVVRLMRYIAAVCKVRGVKTIVKRMSHNVNDWVPLVKLLLKLSTENEVHWTVIYVPLIWSSLVVLLPFSCSVLDAPLGSEQSLLTRMAEVCSRYYLHRPHPKVREASARWLACFTTRPDTVSNPFGLPWLLSLLQEALSNPLRDSILVSWLSVLAAVLKRLERKDIQKQASFFHSLLENTAESASVLVRHWHVKCLSRVACGCLPMPLMKGTLLQSLGGLENQAASEPKQTPAEPYFDPSSYSQLESVIEHFIQSLSDNDTIVRWSSAKALSRLMQRLPESLCEQVLSAVFVFGDDTSDEAIYETLSSQQWHGQCLLLAELARRQALPSSLLLDCMHWTRFALHYPLSPLSHTGVAVRDAAAYVIWSVARSGLIRLLSRTNLQVTHLFVTELVAVSVLDREVGVRRAAAAALQEWIGRMQNDPQAQSTSSFQTPLLIEILQNVHYFSIGPMRQCYLSLAPSLTALNPLIYETILKKLLVQTKHPDAALRQLAGRSLRRVLFRNNVISSSLLIKLLNEKQLNWVALAAVLFSLVDQQAVNPTSSEASSDQSSPLSVLLNATDEDILLDSLDKSIHFPNEILALKENLFEAYEKALKECSYESLYFACAMSYFVTDESQVNWHDLFHAVQHSERNVRQLAIQAIRCLSLDKENIIKQSATMLQHGQSIAHARGGCALLLGCVVERNDELVLDSLMKAVEGNENVCIEEIEMRCDALKSLSFLIRNGNQDSSHKMNESYHKALSIALNDYSQDARGDIGSLLRVCACECLLLDDQKWTSFIPILLRLCCERMDRVRQIAGPLLVKLLEKEQDFNWKKALPSDWTRVELVYQDLMKIMQLLLENDNEKECLVSIIHGLCLACSGIAHASLVRTATHHLSLFCANSSNESKVKFLLGFIQVWDILMETRHFICCVQFLDTLIQCGLDLTELNDTVKEALLKRWSTLFTAEMARRLDARLWQCVARVASAWFCLDRAQSLTWLLGNKLFRSKYSVVRQCVAELLFLLVQDEQSDDEIMDLLLNVDWKKPLNETREESLSLTALLKQK